MRKLGAAIMVGLSLGCGGLGGTDVEGIWCNQDDAWSCWEFEGGEVTYVWKYDKPSEPIQKAPYRVESGDTIIVDWPKRKSIWKITEKTATTMHIYNPERKKTHILYLSDSIPEIVGR